MGRRCLMAAWLVGSGCISELPDVAEPCGLWPEPGLYEVTVEMPDKKRKALVEIGPSEGPRDLIMAIHGGAQSPKEFLELTQFGNLAQSDIPLVVAYPQGRHTLLWRTWNVGFDDGSDKALDVEFLDALVKELEQRTCVDQTLAAGFSRGGMMAMRWACASDVPDGVVSAAGPLIQTQCEGAPKPMRAYHGTADDVVPLQGGETKRGNTVPPAADGWALWRERNECSEEVAETFNFGPMECVRYAECAAPTEVCIIEGWGHAWPGGRQAGTLSSNATVESVEFLEDVVANATTTSGTSTTTD